MLRDSVIAFVNNSNAFQGLQSHVGKLVLYNPPSSSVATSELRFHIWFTLILNLSTRLIFAVHNSICDSAILLCRPRIVVGVSYGRSRPMTVRHLLLRFCYYQHLASNLETSQTLWYRVFFRHYGTSSLFSFRIVHVLFIILNDTAPCSPLPLCFHGLPSTFWSFSCGPPPQELDLWRGWDVCGFCG